MRCYRIILTVSKKNKVCSENIRDMIDRDTTVVDVNKQTELKLFGV